MRTDLALLRVREDFVRHAHLAEAFLRDLLVDIPVAIGMCL
jgi:hypothetical protein